MKVFLLVVCILALISCGQVPQDVTLAWDAPTQNEDGTPLTDLAGYKVHHGNRSGQDPQYGEYSAVVDVGNVTQYTVTGLICGTPYYFAVTAYDTSGHESAYSNEVNWGC